THAPPGTEGGRTAASRAARTRNVPPIGRAGLRGARLESDELPASRGGTALRIAGGNPGDARSGARPACNWPDRLLVLLARRTAQPCRSRAGSRQDRDRAVPTPRAGAYGRSEQARTRCARRA